MKKLSHIQIICFFLLLPLFCFCQDKKTDAIKNGYAGNIKQIKQTCYEASKKFVPGSQTSSFHSENYMIFLNSDGYILLGYNYGSDGSLNTKSTYKYNDKGYRIEGEIFYIKDSLSVKMTFKYDFNGNMVQENLSNDKDTSSDKEIYRYDGKGNKIEWYRYNSDGSLFKRYTYAYNDTGAMIERCSYKKNDSIELKTIYIYKEGKLASENVTSGYKTTYTYNKNKLRQEEWIRDNGNLWRKYLYDEKGNITEENHYFGKNKLNEKYTFIYEYDNKGNWIIKKQKIWIKKGSSKKFKYIITKREITYY